MEYIRQSMAFEIDGPSVLSLGKFDGLHRGHELLLAYMARKKQEEPGLKAVIFTFDIPPRERVQDIQAKVLTTGAEKEFLFAKAGIDCVIECPFTRQVMCMEPEKFIDKIVNSCHVKYMVVGTDFRFGYQRRGDYHMLELLAGQYGYEVEVVDKIQEDGRDISSTFVREEIMAGNIGHANQLLGYNFFTEGTVLHGRRMGKEILGIPTINLIPPEDKLLPPSGVYITKTNWQGRDYPGITNVGCKPTVEGDNPIGVETHLFDVSEDLYGEKVRVSFLKHVRKEQRFSSLEALKEQMQHDIACGRVYFNMGKGVQKN